MAIPATLLARQGQEAPAAETRVERLHVVDAEGNTRILLEAEPSPRIVLRSESGSDLITIAVGGDAEMFPFSEKDVPYISLNAEGDASKLRLAVAGGTPSEDTPPGLVTNMAEALFISTDPGAPVHGKLMRISASPLTAGLRVSKLSTEEVLSVLRPEVVIEVGPDGAIDSNLRAQ
ncbi:MAG: hypothetical protein H6828_06800 [Planctomycetes bacterium]|nr:hypothetical protein [Planctomycetota bacterium]